jgi:hypothetical protein
MKISIGTNIKDGPWGGGNLFAINLSNFLKTKGHIVVNNLLDEDIDIILLTEPRKTSESSAFTHIDVNNYLKFVNNKAIVIHRINECDERKDTNFVNKYLIDVNKSADFTVFVSTWLMNLFEKQGLKSSEKKVILAGANEEVFNPDNFRPWDGSGKLKIVTHHWGANWNKGFDIYKKIDDLLANKKWNEKIDFTYIGNIPKNFKFNNSNKVEPLSGHELAAKIKESHLYITASLNEPSGNHHIEAAQCSLPIMYINSGGIPEYCEEYGLMFNSQNLEEKLQYVIDNYSDYQKKMAHYPFKATAMSLEYLKEFNRLKDNGVEIINKRNLNNLETSSEALFKLKRNFKKILAWG